MANRHYPDTCHQLRLWLNACVPFIDWISDTLSQGYTTLQSLVKCLDHRGIVSNTVCIQARLCQAAQCVEVHLPVFAAGARPDRICKLSARRQLGQRLRGRQKHTENLDLTVGHDTWVEVTQHCSVVHALVACMSKIMQNRNLKGLQYTTCLPSELQCSDKLNKQVFHWIHRQQASLYQVFSSIAKSKQ